MKRVRYTVGLALVLSPVGMSGAGALAAITRSGGAYVKLGAHGSYRTDQHGRPRARRPLRSSRVQPRARSRSNTPPPHDSASETAPAGRESGGI